MILARYHLEGKEVFAGRVREKGSTYMVVGLGFGATGRLGLEIRPTLARKDKQ